MQTLNKMGSARTQLHGEDISNQFRQVSEPRVNANHVEQVDTALFVVNSCHDPTVLGRQEMVPRKTNSLDVNIDRDEVAGKHHMMQESFVHPVRVDNNHVGRHIGSRHR
jgi:hypothetical protein